MTPNKMWIAYMTVMRKELVRIFRIWAQTILPPVVTTSLYFIVFGTFIGSPLAPIQGPSYIHFIVPGPVIMTSVLFSLAGLINGIYAKGFDGISIVPTFVLTPLTYLGGIFYSISQF